MRKKIQIICILFLMGLLIFVAKKTPEEDHLKFKDEFALSNVNIQGDNIYGSGSIYKIDEDTIYIVSNKHLTMYILNPEVYFYDGSSAKITNTINADQIDMGILEVKKEELSKKTLTYIKEINISEKDINIYNGMKVYATGGINGVVLNKTEYHPEFHSNMIRCTGDVESGMSGTGVFDIEKKYLGMISGAKEEEFVFLSVDIMKEEECFGGNLND